MAGVRNGLLFHRHNFSTRPAIALFHNEKPVQQQGCSTIIGRRIESLPLPNAVLISVTGRHSKFVHTVYPSIQGRTTLSRSKKIRHILSRSFVNV